MERGTAVVDDDLVIGIDIGTTSVKAVAIDASGEIVSSGTRACPAAHSVQGRSEQDPDDVVEAVHRTLSEVVGAASGNRRVDGVAISAAMHTLMAVDDDGRPLMDAITWADSRSVEQARRLKSRRDALAIYKRTGVPVHSMTPFTKLLWFRDEQPGLVEGASRWISLKEYVIHDLCGEWAVDASTASTSGMLSLESRDWDEDVIGLVGLRRAQLASPVSAETVVGTVREDLAERLGLGPRCEIVVGASDGALANVGVGATSKGIVACSIGTSGAVRTFAEEPVLDPEGRMFCYPFLEDRFLVGAPINNGGVALQWVRDEFFADLVEAEVEGGRGAYGTIDDLAEKIPPGSDGLLFLPYLLGERAPYWNADVRGLMFGLSVVHGREHIARATLEGVVYQLLVVHRLLEELLGPTRECRVTGGFTRSDIWVQIMADVFRRSIVASVNEHGSALGAALLGRKALGKSDSLTAPEPSHRVFEPDRDAAAVYAAGFEIFESLYEKVEPEFERLSALVYRGGVGNDEE